MNKKSKTYKAINEVAELLVTGKILSIDPSTGSGSSFPGFAWFERGVLMESGILEVNYRDKQSIKLYEIARTIREEFGVPDVLVIEGISTIVYRGSKMNAKGIASLQRAIGAIVGARPFDNVLEIPAASWRVFKPDNYQKTDEWDAITMGICAVTVAREILDEREAK